MDKIVEADIQEFGTTRDRGTTPTPSSAKKAASNGGSGEKKKGIRESSAEENDR